MIVAIYDAGTLDLKPIVCEASTSPGLVTLDFIDPTGGRVSMHLPDKMAACVAMIAEAFNAHRNMAADVDLREPAEPGKPEFGVLKIRERRPLDIDPSFGEVLVMQTGNDSGVVTLTGEPFQPSGPDFLIRSSIDDAAMQAVESAS